MFNIATQLEFINQQPQNYSSVALFCYSTTSPEARSQIQKLLKQQLPAPVVFATLDSIDQVQQICGSNSEGYFAVDKDQNLRSFLERNVPKLATGAFTFILVKNKVVWKGSAETDDFLYWINRVSKM